MVGGKQRGGRRRVTIAFAPTAEPVVALRDLFGELGDLKRIRSAGRDGSSAERGFRRAWDALVAGADVGRVMRATVAASLAAARLGDLDASKLSELGLGDVATRDTLRRAFDDVSTPLDRTLVRDLLTGLDDVLPSGPTPAFVELLAAQPRAGATCPGRPRLILEPAENHAEHCWAVAVMGVLLAPHCGADPATVFLAGLAHHLHNALMPDSGFTGEMLLDPDLERVCAEATGRALDGLPEGLRREVAAARAILPDASTPDGRAFHAADVIDRVLQLAQHLRAASIDLPMLLDEWQLVHAGPVKHFHDAVLAEMGLA